MARVWFFFKYKARVIHFFQISSCDVKLFNDLENSNNPSTRHQKWIAPNGYINSICSSKFCFSQTNKTSKLAKHTTRTTNFDTNFQNPLQQYLRKNIKNKQTVFNFGIFICFIRFRKFTGLNSMNQKVNAQIWFHSSCVSLDFEKLGGYSSLYCIKGFFLNF